MRYLTAIVFASIATAVVVFYAYPAYQDIATFKAQEQSLSGYIAQAKQAQSKIDELVARRQAFPADADAKMKTMIPDSIDDLRLTIDLGDLARQHGLSLANPAIHKLAADKDSTIQQYDVQFSIDAPYATFRSFLDDIEYWLQLRDVVSLSITPGDSLAAPMHISMEFITYALH